MSLKRSEKWGIYAPQKGRVALAYNSKDYGLTVIIEYPCGTRTLHGHNSKLLVETGEYVERNQLIAIMGDTGKGIPKPNKHSHLGAIPKGKPLYNLIENCINPIEFLVRNDCVLPFNTKISTGFHVSVGGYLHEGLDGSGKEENLIEGWENGILCRDIFPYTY